MNIKQRNIQAAGLNGENALFLKAYLTDQKTDVVIRANAVEREWISTQTGGNGYRCIPLNMASSLGWSFLTPFTLTVIYDGKRLGISAKDKRIDATRLVTDQFGAGIFTFYVAVVFRTPPGHNMIVTGPMNEPRRGATPLGGIVETDWAEVNFTMNWKITEPDYPVVFRRGDPFCTFFPYPRQYVEEFVPQLCALADTSDVEARYERWLFNRITTDGIDGNYARGENFVDAGRGRFKEHQRKIRVQEFRQGKRRP